MKSHLRMLALFLCTLMLASSGTGSAAEKKNVAAIIRSFYMTNHVAGLSVAIRDKKRTVTYNCGFANLETASLIRDQTVFRIASVSKLFTTLGILELKEKGRLSLDDALSVYIPAFPHGESIKLRNLLQHTSGIPDFAALQAFSANEARAWTPDELVAMLEEYLVNHDLDFAPGTKADYSNSNFMLLAAVVQAVTGQVYKDFVAQQVVSPLHMKNTGVGSDSEIIRHRAAGYEFINGNLCNAPFVSVVAPFGTGDCLSQPVELAKISDVFTPGVLFSKATIEEMSAPAVLNDGSTWVRHTEVADVAFGYCWELIKPKGRTEWIYTKSGGISGFYAYVLYFKTAGVTLAMSCNTRGDDFTLLTLGLELGEALGATR